MQYRLFPRAAFQAAAQAQVAGRRKLDGVAEQVDEDLLDAQGVTHEAARHLRCQVDAQLQPLFLDMADEQVVDVVEQHGQLEIQLFDAQLAGLDAREVEDVVDDAEQMVGRPADLADVLLLDGIERGQQAEVGQPEDGIERRAHLVRHVGQEVALGAAGRLGLLHGQAQVMGLLLDHAGQVVAVIAQLLGGFVQHVLVVAQRLFARLEGRDIGRHDHRTLQFAGLAVQQAGMHEVGNEAA